MFHSRVLFRTKPFPFTPNQSLLHIDLDHFSQLGSQIGISGDIDFTLLQSIANGQGLSTDGQHVFQSNGDGHIRTSRNALINLQLLQIDNCKMEPKISKLKLSSVSPKHSLHCSTPPAVLMFSWNTPRTLRGPFGSTAATRTLILSIMVSTDMILAKN